MATIEKHKVKTTTKSGLGLPKKSSGEVKHFRSLVVLLHYHQSSLKVKTDYFSDVPYLKVI